MAAPPLPRLVGVVGAGQMGAGIAQVVASSGLRCLLVDTGPAALERARAAIADSLARLARKGQLGEGGAEAVLARLATAADIGALAEKGGGADYVIEAVPESEPLKAAVFRQLDELLPAAAILASNTSSISITRLAAATQRPSNVIGMHFMNPVPLMSLVELIRGLQTSAATHAGAAALAAHLGKATVLSEDRPGFVVNRILAPMINEAFFALMEGVASAGDIDAGMRLGTNQPMGPLALADFIGLDTVLAILRVLHTGLGEAKYRPCPLLVQYVDAGYLGRKSGRGVYEYRGR